MPTNERYEVLKSMHTIIIHMNDETAYFDWIHIIPDEATDEDLRDCAEDDEIMRDAANLFTSLIRRYGKSGGYYLDGRVF